MKTTAAKTAAAIRKEIKEAFPNIKIRCISENFAGGNSVTVYLYDQPKHIYEAIKKICDKYMYGHFDGMTDCYLMSNRNDAIPQVKYISVDNSMTKEMEQKIYSDLRATLEDFHDLPEDYNEAQNRFINNQWVYNAVYRSFRQLAA